MLAHIFFCRNVQNAQRPMSRLCTVSARHHTLLVCEGNQSHVIKNMAARPKVYGVALHDTVHFQPCDHFFLLYPLLYGVVTSDSVE